MRLSFSLVLLALFAFRTHAGLAENDPPAPPSADYCTIDLRRTDENHLFIWGKANGKRISVLVDTGWSATTWNISSVTQANSKTNIARLKLGTVTLTNVPAMMQDVRFNGQPASFGLVLGVDFLIGHRAVIDCAKRKLYLRRNAVDVGTNSASTSAFLKSGFVPNPLSVKTPPALTCPVIVNGHRVEMLVDTAAVWTCLDTRLAESLNLKVQITPRKLSGAGSTGERRLIITEIKTFSIGGGELKKADCAVVDLKDWGLARPGQPLEEVQGILGGAELARLNAIIDCGSLTLWLKR